VSIELYEKIRALEERVGKLEDLIVQSGQAHFVGRFSEQPRKKPGPPKGYKRQPKQAQPNG
jgi:hypothetical protein